MTTLLTVGNSEGERRCDAKCHDATEPECDCICGGRFHGKGEQYARQLIQQDVRAGRFGKAIKVAAEALMEQGTLL